MADRIKIDELALGLSTAMQRAQSALQGEALQNFLGYFEQADDSGGIRAKTKSLFIEYPESGGLKKSRIDVPVASLVSHSHMSLDKIELDLYANIEVEDGVLFANLSPDEKKGMFQKEKAKGKQPGTCRMKLTFRNEEVSDGLKNVTGMLSRNI